MNNPIKCSKFSYKNRTFNYQFALTRSFKNKNKVSLFIHANQVTLIKVSPPISHSDIIKILDHFKEWIYFHPIFQKDSYHYINQEKTSLSWKLLSIKNICCIIDINYKFYIYLKNGYKF